jgi:alkanesulfonate monooxygenase SsuD/methylene tetrahydromethanopterin reductase-like flavin-dependent oxidoreductase (luciferase family)
VKLGVLQFFSWPERRVDLATVYARALQRIEIMDRTGYDAVWLAEHHFNSFSVCPSVHLMGTHVAARTQRLRIGTAVTLAAFYHPLRIAEEIALLDVLSGGRVNFGAGRGFDPTEFRAFGVPVEESAERMQECVEIVLAAWREGKLDHIGRHFEFRDVEVLPKPRQLPHPPVWLAASSPDAVVRAAKKGFSILQDPHSSHAEIGRKRALYRETLEASGHAFAGRELPIARLLACAPTDREAEEIARAGAHWTVGSYAGPMGAVSPEARIESYVHDVILHGSPEKLVDQIAELAETIGLDYLMCAPLSHASFTLFTDQVLPKLTRSR